MGSHDDLAGAAWTRWGRAKRLHYGAHPKRAAVPPRPQLRREDAALRRRAHAKVFMIPRSDSTGRAVGPGHSVAPEPIPPASTLERESPFVNCNKLR